MKQSKPEKSITPPAECTGCGLCANVCAHDAISMVWSRDGFLVPEVDTLSCINCGACVRACPAQPNHLQKLGSVVGSDAPLAAYGAWHRDTNILSGSSSGGIFSALAAHTFEKGGCVFGVVWSGRDTANYARAENMDELAAMRGSKYTQAQPGMVYRQVKSELQKGRQVLFCGASCQVYALRRYLRKNYENLLLVDILCHGTPSRLLLQAYIQEYEQLTNKKISRIQFRDKAGNWQQYRVKKIYEDGTSVSHRNGEDIFMRLFIGAFVLNKACYNCPHARIPRVGDITLGDFWGNLQELHPDWPIANGIGAVLSNTDKGEHVLNMLKESREILLEAVAFDEVLKGQPDTFWREQKPVPPRRSKVLARLRRQLPLSVEYRRLIKRTSIRAAVFGILCKVYGSCRRVKKALFK